MWLSSLLDLNQILDEVDKNKAILLEIWAPAINVNNVWDKTGWACLIKIYVMVHSKAKQSFWSYHNRTMSYLCPSWQKLGKTQQTYFWQLFHPFWFGIKKDVIILIYCQHLSSVSTLLWWHVTQYFALFKAMINLLGYIPPCITVSKLIPIFGWWMRWAEIKQRHRKSPMTSPVDSSSMAAMSILPPPSSNWPPETSYEDTEVLELCDY